MNTTENTNAKDILKVVGALITLAFGALFFFLKLLGDSKSADESEGLFETNEKENNNLTSASLKALSNPNNMNHDN